jgi:hypothetical protein
MPGESCFIATRTWLGLLVLVAACGDAPARAPLAQPPTRPGDVPERRITPARWEPVFRIGGIVDDTSLAMPSRPAASADGVYIVDAYLKRVQFFNLDGTRRWSFGGEGSGPGEFRTPRDLKVDGSGRVWALDPANARLTVVDPNGIDYLEIPLARLPRMPDRVVPLPGGQAILLDHAPDSPFVRIDSAGLVLSRFALPLRGLDEVGSLGAQLVPRGDAVTGRWSAAFMAGDGFFSFDGESLRHPHSWFVEPSPWPEIVTEQNGNSTTRRMRTRVSAASSIATDGERVFIHVDGRSELRQRVLDVYSAHDGTYLESFELPRRLSEIDFRDGILFGTYSDPYPGLEAWRLVRE